jgi:hypothetical protein
MIGQYRAGRTWPRLFVGSASADEGFRAAKSGVLVLPQEVACDLTQALATEEQRQRSYVALVVVRSSLFDVLRSEAGMTAGQIAAGGSPESGDAPRTKIAIGRFFECEVCGDCQRAGWVRMYSILVIWHPGGNGP